MSSLCDTANQIKALRSRIPPRSADHLSVRGHYVTMVEVKTGQIKYSIWLSLYGFMTPSTWSRQQTIPHTMSVMSSEIHRSCYCNYGLDLCQHSHRNRPGHPDLRDAVVGDQGG